MVRVEKHYISKGGRDCPRTEGAKQMTADNWLFLLVISVWTLTAYLIATAPETTAQERKEMEDDWWE